MQIYWVWLALLKGLSLRQKLMLLERYIDPRALYDLDRHAHLPPEQLQPLLDKDLDKARRVLRTCQDKGISILTYTDSSYPEPLRRIDEAPLVLYCRGTIPCLDMQPAIGVVGTRKASPYGLRSAGKLSAQIAVCGGIVVSGGAFGIDSVALRCAMEIGGKVIAVLAGGLDHMSPVSNMPLFQKIMESGCIVSEDPPGTQVYRTSFLRRNRIISGISRAILVVEAPEVSGALNTARWASDQGRDVFAVPGNIDSESCRGSNLLIGDIAKPAMNGWMILSEYASNYPDTIKKTEVTMDEQTLQMLVNSPEKPVCRERVDKIIVDKGQKCPYSVMEKPLPALSEQEKAVAQLLTREPIPMDSILDQVELPPAEVMNIVTRLTLKGVAQSHPGNFVSLKCGG